MQYYNIHSHVFTMRNAPVKFLSLFLPGVAADLIDTLTNTQAGSRAFAAALSRLGGNLGKRYASFLSIGKNSDEIDVFRILSVQYESGFKFAALTMYMESLGIKGSESGFEGQLEGVMDIKQRYPDDLLVFLGIDPRWKGNGTELRQIVEEKFNYRLAVAGGRSVYPYVGLKLYPSAGFYAFDSGLKETFEWAADNGVPIISHCNYLGGIYNNDMAYLKGCLSNQPDPYDNNAIYKQPVYSQHFNLGKWLLGTNKAANNKQTCSYFLEPHSYVTLLEYFQGKRTPLKLCLAHYGGDQQIRMQNGLQKATVPTGVTNVNWCAQIRDLIRQFDGLYTDIAYALFDSKIHKPIIHDLEDARLGDKILFGTDFFLTEQEMPERQDYTAFMTTARAHPMKRVNGLTAWDVIASQNPERFLYSKYYNGNVI
jgi:predicted TIM-barrel fold metal-dependent hydrolase